MNFLAAGRLWLLVVVAALAALYGWQQQHRRRAGAVRFSNAALLASVAPARPGWRRHGPAVGVALALAGLIVGYAKPSGAVRVPKEAAIVMLVIDTSASMQATDVDPSRLDAAMDAAERFVDDLPPQIEVGLVSFDQFARLHSPPTTDHEAIRQAIRGLTLGPGTAAGEGLLAALGAIEAGSDADGGGDGDAEGAAIVLLSDGVTTIGRPVLVAADAAAARGVPVSTIAFGTPNGSVRVQGRTIAVPADPGTMAAVAEATSGTFFEAGSGDELAEVYADIGTRVGFETEWREQSGGVLATATILLVAALGLGLVWNGRLP